MADNTSSLQFCDACLSIDIEKIHQSGGFQLHANLAELRRCVLDCKLCSRAYLNLHDEVQYLNYYSSKRARRLGGKKPWLNEEAQPEWAGRVVSRPWAGEPMFCILLLHRNEDVFDHLQNNERIVYWVSPRTLEHDPATLHGISWIRRLPPNTAAQATFEVAKLSLIHI